MSASTTNCIDNDRVRLHITPFYPELLDKILGPSVRPLASNTTFHSVQTFPERAFGYVELPGMEADKLKKKLNGSALKGTKVRIEDAKPEKKRKVDAGDEAAEDKKARKAAKKEKRRKNDGVIGGHELEDGRHVKRGWSEKGDREKGSKNKRDTKRDLSSGDGDASQEGRMLRFKTTIPPNAAPVESKSKEKSKKKDKADKKDKKNKQVVVQEFDKSKKSANISAGIDSSKHGNVTYEEGRGWVDGSGNVVEPEHMTKKPRSKSKKSEPKSDMSNDVVGDADSTNRQTAEEGMEVDEEAEVPHDSANANSDEEVPASASTDEVEEPFKEVHPLEALFKRPGTSSSADSSKRRPVPIDTSFSFFDPGAADDDDEDRPVGMPPQTPHTKRDMEWRNIRSAAPTPDTAAIGRKFSFPFAEGNDEEDEGDEEDDNGVGDVDMRDDDDDAQAGAAQSSEQDRGEESAFRKWFYDNRGDLNRGWKKRRRDERKQKRQRENRRLSRKIA